MFISTLINRIELWSPYKYAHSVITTFSSNIAGVIRYKFDLKVIPVRLCSRTTPSTREFVIKAIETLKDKVKAKCLRNSVPATERVTGSVKEKCKRGSL